VPKGKTNQPIEVVVADEWAAHPEIVELRERGHRVYGWSEYRGAYPDLILHPAAHGWNDMMWEYLPAAVTAARARKRRR
jgi:hypothetical protein